MSFWDDSYKDEISSITKHIESNINKTEDKQQNYINDILTQSWDNFSNLFKHQRNDLNNFTPYIQKKLSDRAKPTLKLLESNRILFLNLLLRINHEFYFWNPYTSSIPYFMESEVIPKLTSILENNSSKYDFLWIQHSMPSAMLKDLLTSDEFIALRKIATEINDYKEYISKEKDKNLSEFESELNLHIDRANELIQEVEETKVDLSEYEKKLSEYKNDYNFVLLSKAFVKMGNEKKSELGEIQKLTRLFTFALVIAPCFTLLNHIYSWIDIGSGLNSLTYYLPILTFEVLIFYFMRLYYGEGRTIKTQLLQINHRLSLCEFIHDYIEKKNDNSTENTKESWDMFESLIFSPIQSTADNIPSVLDGANAVADMAGKIMSKTK